MSKWIELDTDASTGKPYLWKCDECGEEVETKWNYCPECGDPKTSRGDSINTLVKALEAEHKKLRERQNAQPEIIRCKDCKYAHITYGGEVKYCDIWFPNESHYIDTDNYCSFAERRTDERSDRQAGGDRSNNR